MENQTPQNLDQVAEQRMLMEIYENTRKTKNYMKWQLIITIALVVLPILAMVIIVPIILQTLTSAYGTVLQ